MVVVMVGIRSPIIVCAGHVDHGKTTLLDSIRGTAVTKLEPGMISQHVGASYIPIDVVKKTCGQLLEKFKIKIDIPGLLFVDTPGHAAFTTLRKRGGAVSDLAILVIDINEGFQEQTDESLIILKEYKTPFVIAATKIDKIPGWHSIKNACVIDSLKEQRNDIKDELDKKIYNIVSQLVERGFDAERFDRIENFRKQIAIVPCSGITGEGVSELLMVLSGLAQQFLKDRLKLSERCRGTILEVKDVRGFGTTIDTIIYDGSLKKGNYLVIGGKEPIVTKIKALLTPRPLQELRIEKQFDSVDEVKAAAGIKIAAPDLDKVIAGSPIVVVKDEAEIEPVILELQKEIEEVQFSKEIDGVVVKADTLGSLEAMIKLLKEENIPIRKAEVGQINKSDIMEMQNIKDDLHRVVLTFNVKPLADIEELAKDMKIKIFYNNIIYRLIEEYNEWCHQRKERELTEKLQMVIRPAKVKILKGCIFRSSKPCIVGVEVLAGVLKPGALLKRENKIIGKIKELQREGQNIMEAKTRDRVAISMDEPIAGRTINEDDVLITVISAEDKKILQEIYDKLTEDEKALLEEL